MQHVSYTRENSEVNATDSYTWRTRLIGFSTIFTEYPIYLWQAQSACANAVKEFSKQLRRSVSSLIEMSFKVRNATRFLNKIYFYIHCSYHNITKINYYSLKTRISYYSTYYYAILETSDSLNMKWIVFVFIHKLTNGVISQS